MDKLLMYGIVFFVWIANYGYSQNGVPILTDTFLVKGIYMSFEEFKQNKPSIVLEVNARKCEEVNWGVKHTSYLLDLQEGVKVKHKKVWGFSDGEFVYIKVKNGLIFKDYEKIKYIGRYCYFEVLEGGGGGGMMIPNAYGNPGIVTPPSPPKIHGKILNINNGKVYYLEDNLEMILSKDPELLAEYKSGSREGIDNYRYLVIRYCERHPEDIK